MRWLRLVCAFGMLALADGECDLASSGVVRTLTRNGAELPSLILEANPWNSHRVVTEVAKILLSRKMGYTVTVKDQPTVTTLNSRLSSGESMVNMEVWPDSMKGGSVYETQVVGDNGLVGQKGIYVSKTTSTNYWSSNGDILDHYRSFTCGTDCTEADTMIGRLQSDGLYAAADSTVTSNKYTNYQLSDSSGNVLPTCSGGTSTCQKAGWFYPPQCLPTCDTNPSSCTCATVLGYKVDDKNATQILQNQVAQLGMKMSIVWVGDNQKTLVDSQTSANKPVLFYGWQPDNRYTGSAFSRVHLPNCQQMATDGTCDFPKQQLKILAWPELETVAQPAYEFLEKMSLSNADIQSIFAAAPNNGATAADLEAGACTWAKANTQTTASWIPPPPSCSQDDYIHSVSACDGDDRTVSFAWKYPSESDASKPANCVLNGAITGLPQPFSTDCNIVTSDGMFGILGVVVTSLTVVIGLLALGFIFLYKHHMCFDRTQPMLMAAMICGCLLLQLPGYLLTEELSKFKCAAADFLTQVCVDFIIGCYIVKAQHYTRSYTKTIQTDMKSGASDDIHKKIHSEAAKKKEKVDANKTAVLTADGRLVKEADLDAKEVRRQTIRVAQWCGIEIAIFLLRVFFEPMKPMTEFYKEEIPGTTQSVQLDYILCDSDGGSALYVLSWVYSAVLLAMAMYETLRAEKTGLVPDRYNMHALYNILLWAFVSVFYWTFGDRSPGNVYSVNCTSQILGGGVCIFLLVGPRVQNWRYGASAKVQVLSSSYMISFEDLEIIHQIGEGSYGDVLMGRWKQTKVAIKRLRGQLSDEQMRAFGSEVGTMVELHHPNCVMLMGFCLQPPVLVMEFLGRGSLHQVLHVDKTIFDWTMQIHVLVDCARGMNFLHTHEPKLIHRDLKSPNILVNDNWRCKIADFGLAQLKMANPKDQNDNGLDAIGSLLWCAPEVLNNNPAMAPADVYAFAVIMFEVLYCELPFVNSELMSVPLKVCNGDRPSTRKTPRAQTAMGEHFQTVTGLMEQCWRADPAERPDFSQVLSTLESTAENLMGKHSWEQCVVYPANVKRSKDDAPKTMIDSMQEGDLELGFKIGEGAYGVVFEGIYLNKKVAVKQLFVDGVQEDVREEFHAEVNIMRAMEHPCLVKLLGVMEKMPKLLLVTELMLKGSLWDYYHREKRPTPHSRHMALVLDQAIDMADGMEYLHDKKILHRDLKSQNIWLDENLKCKIGDFGMSRLNTNKTMTLCGSPLWCSPEILRSERYSFPADVFSFAIILWEAFHWAEPYTELTVMEIIVAVTQRNERPDISPMVPEGVQELIRSAWHAQPEKRPMMGFLLSKLQQFRTQVKRNPDLLGGAGMQ